MPKPENSLRNAIMRWLLIEAPDVNTFLSSAVNMHATSLMHLAHSGSANSKIYGGNPEVAQVDEASVKKAKEKLGNDVTAVSHKGGAPTTINRQKNVENKSAAYH